jgi:hypothetical protein
MNEATLGCIMTEGLGLMSKTLQNAKHHPSSWVHDCIPPVTGTPRDEESLVCRDVQFAR